MCFALTAISAAPIRTSRAQQHLTKKCSGAFHIVVFCHISDVSSWALTHTQESAIACAKAGHLLRRHQANDAVLITVVPSSVAPQMGRAPHLGTGLPGDGRGGGVGQGGESATAMWSGVGRGGVVSQGGTRRLCQNKRFVLGR